MADLREGCNGTDADQSVNERAFAGHSLSTDSGEWADPDAPEERPKHYREFQLDRNPHYRGPLERLSEPEVQALLAEMLRYYQTIGHWGIPLPPRGLPGASLKCRNDDEAEDLLELGWRYFRACLLGEGRAMHNLWDKADNFILSRVRRAREEAEVETAQSLFTEWQGQALRQVAEQKVYFISSAAGPIKIGIAVNPRDRLKSLQTAHPGRLTLLATCEGGATQERAYHAQFAEHRLEGEWFSPAPEILLEIARLSSEGAAPQCENGRGAL